jgi:hypothetical protein
LSLIFLRGWLSFCRTNKILQILAEQNISLTYLNVNASFCPFSENQLLLIPCLLHIAYSSTYLHIAYCILMDWWCNVWCHQSVPALVCIPASCCNYYLFLVCCILHIPQLICILHTDGAISDAGTSQCQRWYASLHLVATAGASQNPLLNL